MAEEVEKVILEPTQATCSINVVDSRDGSEFIAGTVFDVVLKAGDLENQVESTVQLRVQGVKLSISVEQYNTLFTPYEREKGEE